MEVLDKGVRQHRPENEHCCSNTNPGGHGSWGWGHQPAGSKLSHSAGLASSPHFFISICGDYERLNALWNLDAQYLWSSFALSLVEFSKMEMNSLDVLFLVHMWCLLAIRHFPFISSQTLCLFMSWIIFSLFIWSLWLLTSFLFWRWEL